MNAIANERQPNESFEQYKERRKQMNKMIKNYLKQGQPAMAAKDGKLYVTGPHRTHALKDHIHSGTLVKYRDDLSVDNPHIL